MKDLSKHIDLSLWESMQESFSSSTGIPLCLFDTEGKLILTTENASKHKDFFESAIAKEFLDPLIERAKTEEYIFRTDEQDFQYFIFPLNIERKLRGIVISPMNSSSELETAQTRKLISNFLRPVFLLSFHMNIREQHLRKLKVLQSISKMINSTLILEQILVFIANFMRRAFTAEACSIIVAEKSGDDFVMGKRVISLDNVDEKILQADKIACKQFLDGSEMHVINDLELDPRFMLKDGPRCLVSLALNTKEKRIGLVNIYGDNPLSREDEDYEVLTAIIELAATAINNASHHELVHKLSITDPLTGLYTRRYFMEALQNELARFKRFKEPLSLLMFDVDHFKHYNDTNGHQAGDRLLKKLGDLFLDTKRDSDIAGRYGGEEFIMIMPRTDATGAHRFAERLRKIIEEYKFEFEEKQPSGDLTISMGVITTMFSDMTLEALIAEADKNLYKAKAAGRNKVVATVKIHKDLGNISIV